MSHSLLTTTTKCVFNNINVEFAKLYTEYLKETLVLLIHDCTMRVKVALHQLFLLDNLQESGRGSGIIMSLANNCLDCANNNLLNNAQLVGKLFCFNKTIIKHGF